MPLLMQRQSLDQHEYRHQHASPAMEEPTTFKMPKDKWHPVLWLLRLQLGYRLEPFAALVKSRDDHIAGMNRLR